MVCRKINKNFDLTLEKKCLRQGTFFIDFVDDVQKLRIAFHYGKTLSLKSIATNVNKIPIRVLERPITIVCFI